MSDVLAALLHHVRIETSFFGRIELGAPWGARLPQTDTVSIHHVLEGEVWLEIGDRTLCASRGDLLLLPRGVSHCLRHAPDAPVVDAERWMAPLPSPGAQSVRRRLGGAGRRTVVLCATLRVTGAGRALLLRTLPLAVHVVGADREPLLGLERLLDGIRVELRERRPGSPVMASRFVELLVLQAIRVELERRAAGSGWTTGFGDDRIARALSALYDSPQRPWTVAALAKLAGESRSGFARAFREQVGESPLRHLTRWRIELAKEKLDAEPDTPIAEIALQVGYQGEPAFSVAFRRGVGMPPGAYRRRPR